MNRFRSRPGIPYRGLNGTGGGPPPAFKPTDISGNVLWLDASDTSTISHVGGSVSQWNDKSGQGNNATQATGAAQPQTGVTTINGNNALLFDGVTDTMQLPAALYPLSQGANTAFVVYNLSGTGQSCPFAGVDSGTGRFRTLIQTNGTALSFNHGSGNINRTITYDNLSHLISTTRNAGNINLYRENVTGSAANATNINMISLYIGSQNNASAFHPGAIAEVIFYNQELSQTDREKVAGYLAVKWGVLSGRTVPTIDAGTMVAQNTPDASGGDPGKGFTCTGLAYDATDNTFWDSNDGRNVFGDTTYLPSLVHTNKTGDIKLGEILLAPLFPSAQSIQGITIDTSDQTLWFCSTDENLVRHVTKAGADLGSIAVAAGPNGLAYNPINDSLYVGDTSGVAREYSCSTGTLLNTYNIMTTAFFDHFWFDVATNRLWCSNGDNGSNGTLRFYDITRQYTSNPIVVPGADAIEGIYMDGTYLWVLNDAYFHAGNPPLNRMLRYNFDYRNAY